MAVRELLKYPDLASVTVVDLDPVMTRMGAAHPVLVGINEGSLNDPRVRVVNTDALGYLTGASRRFGVILIDLPDPDSVDLMHVYSRLFYESAKNRLLPGGIIVTQATSPYFSNQAFLCIVKTMQSAGISVLPYHNQIPTMGEWGWVIGVKAKEVGTGDLKHRLSAERFDSIETRFLNQDAIVSMIHFGKGVLDQDNMAEIQINTQANPVLHRYYWKGTWAMY